MRTAGHPGELQSKIKTYVRAVGRRNREKPVISRGPATVGLSLETLRYLLQWQDMRIAVPGSVP